MLAIGVTRGWRATWQGVDAGLGVLGVVVAVARSGAGRGSRWRRCASSIGGLLLIFGLQWLRKAILRAGGYKALHDEDATFAERGQCRVVGAAGRPVRRPGLVCLHVVFKAVVLEGLEVAFIVVTFGANSRPRGCCRGGRGDRRPRGGGGRFAVRAPLSRVPENA